MPNKDELLKSIDPGMKLDKAFFLKVYGYELSYLGFSETAIKALEDAGCSKARSYYNQIVVEYESDEKRNNGLKEAAEWLRKEIDRKYENMVKEYERKDGKEPRKQEKIDYKKGSKQERWSKFGKVLNFK